MTLPNPGAIMTLEQALALTDNQGNPLNFEKQQDGTYIAKVQPAAGGKKGKRFEYTYTILPQPQVVQIEITKSDADKERDKAIEEKSKQMATAAGYSKKK